MFLWLFKVLLVSGSVIYLVVAEVVCWGKEKTEGCMEKGTRENSCWPFFGSLLHLVLLRWRVSSLTVQCSGDLG